MPSPPANAADDLTAAPSTVTAASPDTPEENKTAPELAGADLQPIEGLDPEGAAPLEPLPSIVTEAGPVLRSDMAAADVPAPEPAPAEVAPLARLPTTRRPPRPQRGWWQRLTEGMRRTSSSLSDSVTGLFTKRKLDDATLEELEDALVQADLGVPTAMRITEAIAAGRYNKEISPQEVKAILAGEVEKALQPVAQPLDRRPREEALRHPHDRRERRGQDHHHRQARPKIPSAGPEGDARRRRHLPRRRHRAAEGVGRAGRRTGPRPRAGRGCGGPGLSTRCQEAKANGTDVLLIDTAGRLQNKAGLMAELEKIVRVVKKFDPSAPHATLLVLDATVGQNAISQVELFQKAAGVTGLVMTKLDGTARGGILVALAAKFGLPVHFIGVGEGVEDLEPFTARDFAKAIAGLEG